MERCEQILMAPVVVPNADMTMARDTVYTDKLVVIQNRTGGDIYYQFLKDEPAGVGNMILLADTAIAWFSSDLLPSGKLWLYQAQGAGDKDIHVGRGV